MAIIEYSDGTKIEFNGTPTQKDVEEAYAYAKGSKQQPQQPQQPETGFLGTRKGDTPYGKLIDNSITRGIQSIFPGQKVGEAIGTLAGYGITNVAEATGFVPKGSSEMYNLNAPTPLQTAGDVAMGALSVAPVGRVAQGVSKGASALGAGSKFSSLLGEATAGGLAGYGFDVASDVANTGQITADTFKPGVGTAVGALAPIGLGVASGASNVIGKGINKFTPTVLSKFSSVPEEAYSQIFKNREPIMNAIKQGVTPKIALDQTQNAVKTLRRTLSDEWQKGTLAIADEFTGKRYGLPDKTIKNILTVADDFALTDKLPQNLKNMSAKETMGLITTINSIPRAVLATSPKGALAREVKDLVSKGAVKTFGGNKGSFAKLYKDYSVKKEVFDAADTIVDAYEKADPIGQKTALNRLQKIFDEDAISYLDAITKLEKATNIDLLSAITASKFSNAFPKLPKGNIVEKALRTLLIPLTSPKFSAKIGGFLQKAGSKLEGVNIQTGIKDFTKPINPTIKKPTLKK